MVATVETIAAAYLSHAEGDAGKALRLVIADDLADLCEAERRTRRAERLVSHGYARGRVEESAAQSLMTSPDARAAGEARP